MKPLILTIFFSFFISLGAALTDSPFGNNNKKVLYFAYYEKDEMSKDNLRFFLNNGLLDSVDHFFVINGECSVPIPNQKNVFVIRRENIGYDFGAFAYVIQKYDLSGYDYHIFCNTSVRGPFLPPMSCNRDWTKRFIQLLDNETKLVGTTINIFSGSYYNSLNSKYFHSDRKLMPHVQTMMFVMDKECFNFLMAKNFFDLDRISKYSFEELIALQEVNLSLLVLQNGWNIGCTAPRYQGVDYRKLEADFNPVSLSGDAVYPGAYFGRTLDPYEVIFYKTNRLPIPSM